jgi:hypothetical protein
MQQRGNRKSFMERDEARDKEQTRIKRCSDGWATFMNFYFMISSEGF